MNPKDLAWYRDECKSLLSTVAALNLLIDQNRENYECSCRAAMAVEEKLKADNAALRADKERLDFWYRPENRMRIMPHPTLDAWMLDGNLNRPFESPRAAIDEARAALGKERAT